MAASPTSRRAPAAPVRARPARRSSPAVASSTARTPRDYAQRTPKKMKAAALRGALSDRARDGRVHVVERAGRRRRRRRPRPRSRRWPRSRPSASTCSSCSSATTTSTWLSLRNVDERAPARRRPAQHLRRAVLRRRGLHPGRATTRSSPARPRARKASRTVDQAASPTTDSDVEEEHQVSTLDKDPRDVLLAPVVSEKSYGLLDENKYTFLVRPRRQQDRDQDRGREGLRRQGRLGQHAQPPGQAPAHPLRARQAQGHQARDRQPRRGQRIDIFGGPVS